MALLLATADTFTKNGRYVYRGQTVDESEVDYVKGESTNLIPAPSGAEDGLAVEISAIAPSGPNPQNPQQLPIGAHQTPGGYVQDGVRLVGEVTVPEKQRIEVVGIDKESTLQSDMTEALDNAKADAAEDAAKAAKADVAERRKEAAKAVKEDKA